MRIDGQNPGINPTTDRAPIPKEAPKTDGMSFSSAFTRALKPAPSATAPSTAASSTETLASGVNPAVDYVPRPPGLTASETESPAQIKDLGEANEANGSLPTNLKGKVVGVKDGNSMEILSDGKIIAVKIYGIDCPEKSNPTGKIARHYVAVNAFMNDVEVEITGTKSDGTLIGKVMLAEGKNLGSEMIKQGIAWWDKESAPEETDLAQIEKQARDAYLGIWAGATEEDEENDWGKEVLVKREQAEKGNGNLLTQLDPK